MAEIIGGEPNRFLTLTIRRAEGETPVEALERLNRAWRLLRQRICRKLGWEKVPSFVVVEKHVSGWPHLHIFLRCPWLDRNWLSAQMADILDSPQVWIQAIDQHGRAAAYAAKYCGKCNQQIGTKKRYYKTRTYEQRPDRKEKLRRDWRITYSIHPEFWRNVVALFHVRGYNEVTWHDGFAVVWKPP